MNIPRYTSQNPILCSSLAERNSLIDDQRYRVAGLSVLVNGVLYWLNSDLSTWSPQGASLYTSAGDTLLAGSGVHTLLTIPIASKTDAQITVTWNCYDGSTNRVSGTTTARAIRTASAISLTTPASGADFYDSTAGGSSPWSPTIELSGNNVVVKLTADSLNGVVEHVSAAVSVTSTADAPTPVDPIEVARAALHATTPDVELYADTGRTPATTTPGTVITAWADQSGNSHNAASDGSSNVTYTPDAGSAAALLFPASGGHFTCSGALVASQNHIFAWRSSLGDAVGAAIEILIHDGSSGRYISINFTDNGIYYAGDSGAGVRIGTAVAGEHDFAVVLNNTAHTATLYIDGVAGTPTAITADANTWSTICLGGEAAGATYPFKAGSLYYVCHWNDITNAAARIAAAAAFGVLAYGAHA